MSKNQGQDKDNGGGLGQDQSVNGNEIYITLFEPDLEKIASDIRVEYPELAEKEEFKDLKPKQIRFCWLVANKTSPLYSIKDKKVRTRLAVELAYGADFAKDLNAKAMYDNGKFTDAILIGMEGMANLEPTLRLRAKLLTEYILDRLQLISILSDKAIELMDGDSKKKSADLLMSVAEKLPKIIKLVEDGYGIKVKSMKKTDNRIASIKDVINDIID